MFTVSLRGWERCPIRPAVWSASSAPAPPPRWPAPTCFPDQFIQSVGIFCLDAYYPAHGSKENCDHHNQRNKHQGHRVTYNEGTEPPEEVEPTEAFLVHNLHVGGPFQHVVQMYIWVNADRRGWGLFPPEVYYHLLCLHHVQLQVVQTTTTHKLDEGQRWGWEWGLVEEGVPDLWPIWILIVQTRHT